MATLTESYAGKRVFLTGHTGFKGSWLCEWLLSMGADVWGYSLPPPTTPSLFEQLGLEGRIHHTVADIRDAGRLEKALLECRPDYIFHLAAQPLVRLSYKEPVETYATNVMGTVHVLEAARKLTQPCAAVFITTDKCYENREQVYAYKEEDPLGGYDPYSSSKAAAEIAIAAYRRSFFNPERLLSGSVPPVGVASARAGNVIGGGDWALDRIVPDCIRSLQSGTPIEVRNPAATRPWQHVLEPVYGYLLLGARISASLAASGARGAEELPQLCSAFNFGPEPDSNRNVRALVEEILKHWRGAWVDRSDGSGVHEAKLLNLSSMKAKNFLQWFPKWNFSETIEHTVSWYRSGNAEISGRALLTRRQITDYSDSTQSLTDVLSGRGE